MKLKNLVCHLIAMTLAYGLVLFAPVLCDFFFDTHVQIYVVIWCNIGLFVMRAKNMPFPIPDMGRIDVVGGLKTLWWAVFWPNYLIRR
ncbi:hypothetical protein [Undibacterium terreum]|uniref:Uncharacterized protein n=1 Tax=Undibacterium terreum TaxID=1224302 RepID=A0A916UKY8_9BURK|nr:hypothetical protein [Undibacterium terreum]GGC76915.1 hypothetical protein GCM10011396_25180 [Undibacterium terreum]